jgi:hypothetical protein
MPSRRGCGREFADIRASRSVLETALRMEPGDTGFEMLSAVVTAERIANKARPRLIAAFVWLSRPRATRRSRETFQV